MERRIAFLLPLLSVYSFAAIVDHSEIRKDRLTIQIAVSKSKSTLEEYAKKYKKYDLYIEKINNYTLYAVNIDKKEKNSILQDIKKGTKDAFLIRKKNFFKNKLLEDKKEDIAIYKQDKLVEPVLKSISKIEYEKALYFFKQKNYEKAYELFSQLFMNKMDDLLINYYLGRSAYETKRFEFAISAYDRILISKPNNHRVRLELAQTYMQMGLYSQAKTEFETVLTGKLPNSVREKVIASIEYIESKQKKHYFNATALISYIYDSNINATSDITDFDIYSPIVNSNVRIENNSLKQGASIFQLATVLNYKYKIEDDFILDTTLVPVILKYNNFKEKDINLISLNISPTWIKKDYKFSLGLLYDHVYLGHAGYQKNLFINPKYTRALSDKSLLEMGTKFGKINFNVDDERDADIFQIQSTYKYASDDFGMFSFGLEFSKEREVNEQRTDVSLTSKSFQISNSYDFLETYVLQTKFNFEKTQYKDTDVNFLTRREDIKRDYSISIQKMITKDFIIDLGTTYTHTNSNHQPFDYDKYIIRTNLLYSF